MSFLLLHTKQLLFVLLHSLCMPHGHMGQYRYMYNIVYMLQGHVQPNVPMHLAHHLCIQYQLNG